MINKILYFPKIEFQKEDYDWLVRVSLFWDEIYRIVPADYEPQDDSFIKELSKDGEVGIGRYLGYTDDYGLREDACDRFLTDYQVFFTTYKYEFPEWENDVVRLHRNKADFHLFHTLSDYGLISKRGEGWYYVPRVFADAYMSYLAEAVANERDMSIATPDSISWLSSCGLGSNSHPSYDRHNYKKSTMLPFYIGDILPLNTNIIPASKILDFRKNYHDERQNFMQTLQQFTQSMARASCEEEMVDLWNRECNRLDAAIKDFKSSARILGAIRWGGQLLAAVPILFDVIGIQQNPLLQIGALVGGGCLQKFIGKKTVQKTNAYSYLFKIQELDPRAVRHYPTVNRDVQDYLNSINKENDHH